MKKNFLPLKQGLYNPEFEHDSCGVGFVCNIKGKISHEIIDQGLEVLLRLSHRGATGADPATGDGAGILIQMPHDFFFKVCLENKIDLPEEGNYGTGLVFLPRNKNDYNFCKKVFSDIVSGERQSILGWRNVPIDDSDIGRTARETAPLIEQVFIGKRDCFVVPTSSGLLAMTCGGPRCPRNDNLDFERKLYVIRKKIENAVRLSSLKEKKFFYITNLSSRTFAYKGLLMPSQLQNFFLDLKDESLKSAICLVHSRYSTNTFPAWDLSQPFRFLAHNGEINTLRGNINWMKAREAMLKSNFFGKDLKKILPVIVPGGSDSAALDNVFELLALSGRSIEHVMTMLVPPAWQNNSDMPQKLKDFYKYHTCLIEPWDGPASIAFTDGTRIGAILDRNGLRPSRYILTKDDLVVMASEVGVLDIEPSRIILSGRLEPGKMFFIDTKLGRIIDDREIKDSLSKAKPYSLWVKKNMVELDDLKYQVSSIRYQVEKGPDILTQLKVFGYTREDLKFLIKPMAEKGAEPIGSMGNDTPHAVLSKRPQLLYNYFKQLFAQVTNPAIDPIREELVMSLQIYAGPEKNILEEGPFHCHKLRIKTPILTNEELLKASSIKKNGFRTKTISLLFDVSRKNDFKKSIDRICSEAERAIEKTYSFIILSDRGINRKYASIPMLLAVGAVHHYLVKKSLRARIGIIVESAEPREVHHFALLFGYGADAVNPYLAYELIKLMIQQKELDLSFDEALHNYIKAVDKGILKILSKMGISTLQSYRAAQIFEAVGLDERLIGRCFTGTTSRIGGAGLEVIREETVLRHNAAFLKRGSENILDGGGIYQWKKDSEFHLWNPDTIAALQDAARNNDCKKYEEFSRLINDQSKNPTTLRSLLRFKKAKSISIEEVEPAKDIIKRFVTGAMSFGSISRTCHETIAIAMNRLGAKSNTGEGGEDTKRFIPLLNGDFTRSAIKQVASGRFGVTTNYLVNADELQIKIAQGAKPGEGGQLPGHKVSVTIAATRYTTPGVTLISPPPHHDIYSIEDLAQLIFDLKNVNPLARISVKLVSEIGVGTIAAGVAKGHADMILISGGDGGTGASPLSSIRHAGLPWELGLSETHQTLLLNDLRSRVRLQTDGQMRTGRDVAIAALLGAEEFGFCTSILIVLGCVMLRHCHLNNCAMGIATQEELLEKRFSRKPEYIINYFNFVAEELRGIMSQLGIKNLDEMIGRVDLLELNKDILPWKAKEIDFSEILYMPRPFHNEEEQEIKKGRDKPSVPSDFGRYCTIKQDHGIDNVLDKKLIAQARPSLERKEKVFIEKDIKNSDRAIGAMLSGEVSKLYGEEGLPEDTIHCKFRGVSGQSFGAWLTKGITFELEGMANDYVGKGLSGGKIIIYPHKDAPYRPEKNIIIGNTTFYGAINGEAYIRGIAGERFCIRNSGAYAVVEGVGDHGCEYMTGGRVVVLGPTGRNFAAGMSGGIAYVYDKNKDFKDKYNMEMVELEGLDESDINTVRELLKNHHRYTQSIVAKEILDNFYNELANFVKVMPIEYKYVLKKGKVYEKDLVEILEG
jgi:glutamate synthase domain-containing protein 2/glutamate synthase domain-containing protein 1/glutamate synthase domain-containing protein 3